MPRVGRVKMIRNPTGIPPYKDIDRPVLFDQRIKNSGKPVVHGDRLQSSLRKGIRLTTLTARHFPKNFQRTFCAFTIVRKPRLPLEMVEIKPQKINIIIARVTFKILLRTFDPIGRIAIDQMLQTLFITQIIDNQTPQGNVFVRRTEFVPPPEPTARVFVQRTEKNRNRFSGGSFQRREKFSHTIKPQKKLCMVFPSRQQSCHHIASFQIPGIP